MSAVLSEPVEKLFGRDSFLSISLIKSLKKLCLFGWGQLDRRLFVTRKDRDDCSFGESQSFNDDLAVNNRARNDLHKIMILCCSGAEKMTRVIRAGFALLASKCEPIY